jgi:fatty-acyl-CoA synthase
MATTVGSALSWWARTKGDATAFIVAEEDITFRELHQWTSRLARALVDSGIRPGDRVGLAAVNCLPWPVAALAVIKAGAVLVPLNPRLKPAEIRKIADDSEIVAAIAAPAQQTAVNDASAMGTAFTVLGFDLIERHRTGDADGFQVVRDVSEAISVIFTSGSTGTSKGVILTTRTLLDIVLENTLTQGGFAPGTVSLLLVPLAFTPGLVYGVLMSSILGGKLIIEPDLDPSRAIKLIEEHRVRALFGVPLIFESLSRAQEFAAADLRSLQTVVVGGAAVPTDLLNRWARKGVLLRQIYGMTESGGVSTATLPAEALDHPGSCGSGLIFTDVRVMADDGSFAPAGTPGELVIRGPGVTPGYWKDPETTAVAIRDGWLHSGDVGVADSDGRVTFVDRMKDLIISGGINISPVELETAIIGLDGVAEVSVIAAPHPRFGETPAAIVVPVAGSGISAATISAHCEQVLASYKVPRYVVLRDDSLPRLPSGKIAKVQIREEYQDLALQFDSVR